jgi:hypothetical protein
MYEYNSETALPYKNLDGALVEPPARLTQQYLLSNKLPVNVLTAVPPQSVMTFTIKQGGGLPGAPLRINRSKVPTCVTDQFSHDVLRSGGRDIWNSIDKGMLVLVWPSDADTMRGSSQNAESERQKISKWSSLNTEKSKDVLENERIIKAAQAELVNAEQEQQDEQGDPVNARIMDIMSRVQAGEVKLDKAVRELDDLADVLTERDYQYAVANAKAGKLREWLQAALANFIEANPPTPKKKVAKKPNLTAKRPVTKAGGNDVFDDNEPEMTDEEREVEAQAEMAARQRQKIGA